MGFHSRRTNLRTKLALRRYRDALSTLRLKEMIVTEASLAAEAGVSESSVRVLLTQHPEFAVEAGFVMKYRLGERLKFKNKRRYREAANRILARGEAVTYRSLALEMTLKERTIGSYLQVNRTFATALGVTFA